MTNYRDAVANEVTQAKENRSSNNNDDSYGRGFSDLEQIEVDMGETPFVKFYPTTALTGTFPEDEGNPIIRFRDEQNNGHGHQGYLGLVVDDLTVDQSTDGGFDMSEAYIVETDDDDYTEYRTVNFGDDDTTEKFGGEAVNIDGDQYGIDEKVTTIEGRSILVVDRTAAVSVAKKLDVSGATPAGMDPESDDDLNSGLIEYLPNDMESDDGVSWRYARRPELREELLGEEVTLLVSRREEIDDGFTGYTDADGNYALSIPEDVDKEDVEPHDSEEDASYAELVAADDARGMMWYSVFDEDGAALSPIEGESTNRPFLEWSFDPTASYLPTEQAQFVNEYQSQGLPTDEDTIVSNVRENFGDDTDEEKIIGLIQSGTTIDDPA